MMPDVTNIDRETIRKTLVKNLSMVKFGTKKPDHCFLCKTVFGSQTCYCDTCSRKGKPYSEVLTHEAVDDGISEAVGHRNPVASEESSREVDEFGISFWHHQVAVEVNEEVEDMDGQPAHREQDHHSEHHLNHL
ncbi:uncharacterized protein TNIN_33851 [Trichonephila inaurata madagascariensis]|uniref:Uncharacterized protein n=1 Tax=Trichonephila inaurata madagascariensis TaxID=2747483 RepID=A0A8X7C046_9ARAC|nr:uncharacterized protein TNIN_33851 [Trichonephila inaurata madagascariensis]